MPSGWRLTSVVVLVALPFAAGCFVGYDSGWGQQKRAQQHAARRSTPAQLPRDSSGVLPGGRRVLKVRVYATAGYAASVLDWKKQFSALIGRVNAVFGAEFGARFELAELLAFPSPASEDKLEAPLQELVQLDPASDVDWVVGLVVATPRFAASADDLGVARLPGRHIVLRAMSDAHEYEAIERAFTELSEDERQKLYRVRKQHKLAITFLHEIAHTLGVPHELQAESIMNPRYHVEASDFSEEAAAIMRSSLASRVSPDSPVLDAALASKLDASLRAAGSQWEPTSRDALLLQTARFLSVPVAAAKGPASSKTPAPSSVSSAPAIGGMNAQERVSFDMARAELNAGHAERAQRLGAPLFAKYSALPAVQSLRCDTAMAIGGDWETIRAECSGLSPFDANK